MTGYQCKKRRYLIDNPLKLSKQVINDIMKKTWVEMDSQNIKIYSQARSKPTLNSISSSMARLWMGFVLLFSDLVSLLFASSLALVIWSQVRSDLILKDYLSIAFLVFMFPLSYVLTGLYPAIGKSPVEELRGLTIATTVVFLLLGTMSFYMHNAERFSRASFGIAWVFALFMVPVSRNIFRAICSSIGLWGEPVALIGYEKRGQQIWKFLKNNPKLGYRPVVVLNGYSTQDVPTVPLAELKFSNLSPDLSLKELEGVKTAILIPDETPKEFLSEVIEGHWHKFQSLIMISDEQNGGSVWVTPHDIGGILGLEVRQNLLNEFHQVVKRFMDLSIIILTAPAWIVCFGLIGIMIVINSPGPVFYRQKRIGKNGNKLMVWKFRTMINNADQVLEDYLTKHADLREEWKATQKIKNDPRTTSIGKFLRRFSLDELPQIINVIKGEMSLVGPRPIVEEEIDFYKNHFHLYKKVKPGMTGLWQVSGRNDTTYEERVKLDEYYVRNWSAWADIYILASTAKAVLSGKGAY
ncbi:MAG: undecaprenyl-phosphate galactose phosphotransferase WbaP [Anaerolineales bacterium]|nr:undecaprenyl-phosphate galactose phosphotransferase WbaP [Anaerolineales bacterium]